MANGKYEFKLSESEEVGYLSMPDHPGDKVLGIVTKQLRLIDLCGDYKGPDIYFDFDKDNRLVGIEMMGK